MNTIRFIFFAGLAGSTALSQQPPPIEVGAFSQDVRQFYTMSDGLPSDDIHDVAVAPDGTVYVATAGGLATLADGTWKTIVGETHVYRVTIDSRNNVHFLEDGGMGTCGPRGEELERQHTPLHASIPGPTAVEEILVPDGALFVASEAGAFVATDRGGMMPFTELEPVIPQGTSIRDIAFHERYAAVAAATGLAINDGTGWNLAYPGEGVAQWNPLDTRAIAYDVSGRLWLATPQGVAVKEGDAWKLFTGKEGLPYADFTSIAIAPGGAVWFATHKGAVRYDGERWAYRQGLRWLPDDDVRDVAVGPDGAAWFATAKGLGVIRPQQTTLSEKAIFFEDEIDKYHRRTPYEYVLEVSLANPGDKSQYTQHDSDNDGLWTGMYGAGECFAYAATKDPKAKERAKKAFEALHFLGEVTQGGSHPAPKGFVARSILPTSGPDPNINDSPERDRKRQKEEDPKWKIITPRWPVSADGQWYWKSDTSSDELDGHYFFYGLYYDLVANTDDEKARVREHVRALTDNIVDHDFNLVDHDGLPTRWAVYSPKSLNGDPTWFGERGLNSLSILSYLATAEHITGDAKYREAANRLINEHGYLSNMLSPKVHFGIGTGNQSDDEMAFMAYYNLLNYEQDEELRRSYLMSMYRYWMLEEPEANPFFTFAAGAIAQSAQAAAQGPLRRLGVSAETIARAVEELKRFPLDRFNWGHDNSERLDIVRLPRAVQWFSRGGGSGYRVDGYVIPVDERYFNHYNHNPWSLRQNGDGRELGDGAVYLLPYYMGLYHGFLN